MKRIVFTVVAGLCVSGTALGTDLATIYDRALTSDPTLAQGEAQHLGSRETKTQAMLNLLPINGTANKSWSGVGTGADRVSNSNPSTATLGLSVNLFSWNSWVNLKQANATVAQAEANYQSAKQDLVSRVTQRYFAVLSAADQLEAQDSALRSAARQLEQAERRFEVGLIAVTDVQIARAARDSSSASVIAGRRAVASAQEQLRAITGEKYNQLAEPRPDMPLLNPAPASEDAWVSAAMNGNATLNAARMAAEIAHDSYLAAVGGHIPNITVGASRNWLLGGTNNTATAQQGGVLNTTDVTWSAGISVPIFTAGLTQSKVRQAKYAHASAQAAFERTLRLTEQQTRDAYQAVISQIAQVQALSQAVESNRISLQATEAGYEVGTKTALDVLTSRQQLVQAQTSFAQAKYGYLNSIVALRLASGELDVETIKQINGWLEEKAPVTAAPVTPAATGAITPAAPAAP